MLVLIICDFDNFRKDQLVCHIKWLLHDLPNVKVIVTLAKKLLTRIHLLEALLPNLIIMKRSREEYILFIGKSS